MPICLGFWGTTRKEGLRYDAAAAAAGLLCLDLLAVWSYPSHLLPLFVQRVHSGLVSSHFTRRVLNVTSDFVALPDASSRTYTFCSQFLLSA